MRGRRTNIQTCRTRSSNCQISSTAHSQPVRLLRWQNRLVLHYDAATMRFSLSTDLQNFRLGLYAADFSEAYSFVRVAGPFETMSHEDRRLSIIRPPRGHNGEWSLTWDWILQCDALYLFHPLFDVHLHCMATARRLGRAVWVALWDDILYEI